jgi:type I restriction enzyme S subunit
MKRCLPIGSLPKDWKFVQLRGITHKIGSGATPRGGKEVYVPVRERYALVRSQNVFDRRFDTTGLVFISDEHAEQLKHVHLQEGDILLNITGDGITFGRSCIVPNHVLPACVNQHVSIIRVNKAVCDPGFLISYLTHPTVKTYIESFNSGGSRRAITKGHIESFLVPLPSLSEQRAIARILGSLDNKIESNRKMHTTLEAMAQAIFRSWFVDFDPVRAKMEGREPVGMDAETAALFPDGFEVVDGKEMPKGWDISPVGDIIELAYGKALKKEVRREGSVPVYGSNGQVDWHDEKLVEGPGIIVGRKGNPGVVVWSPTDFFPIDTTFYVILKSKSLSLHYLYYELMRQDLGSLGADSAVPGLNRNLVYMNQIVIPLEISLKNLTDFSSRFSIQSM